MGTTAESLRISESAKLARKVSYRVFLLVNRFYLWDYLNKPLEHYTDEEFLRVKGLGPKTLQEIRKVIPALPE
jgi:hypothetical protein